MSITILKFAESFVAGRLSAEVFAEAYMELWENRAR
ncbi:colicin immunity domain-containing protein [Cupriavidus basilensis]